MSAIHRRPLRLACLAALCCTVAVHAQDGEDELAGLLALLQEETELATRSKQNADYVPGVISIVQGADARLLGAVTALDAIAMVPGMDVGRDQFGAATIRVRSVDFFFNSGNVKVLIDGLPVTRESAFLNSAVLLMPIEQVERIELIRGPGTGVHGDFAYMGLVNLVTRRDGNELGLAVGRGSRRSAHAVFDAGDDEGVRLRGSLTTWHSDRYDTTDALPNDERRDLLSLVASWRGFEFQLAGIDREHAGQVPAQGGPGPGNPAPPGATETRSQDERSINATLRYRWQGPGPEDRASAWLQRMDSDYRRGGFVFDGPRTELGTDLVRRMGRHLLLVQGQVARLGIDRAVIPQGPQQPPLVVDDSRTQASLTVQDQISFGDAFTLVPGLRWDDIEGIDDRVSPRVAAIWQVHPQHMIKVQYAEGFRSTTVQEYFVGGPPEPRDFEHVSTTELSWIHRKPKLVIRATGFVGTVDDMLFPRPNPQNQRMPEIDFRGIELELVRQISRQLELRATWSTANADDGRAAVIGPDGPTGQFGGPSVAQPESLGNLSLLWRGDGGWSTGLHWLHVGRRADRGQAGFQPGYDLLNASLAWESSRQRGLRIDAGVRNLLKDEVVHFETGGPGRGLTRNRYEDRVWHLGLSWRFD